LRYTLNVTFWIGLATALLLGRPALAQGIPVIDSSAISAAQQSLASLQQQVQQLQALTQTAQSLAQSIGTLGKLANPSLVSPDRAGLSQFASQFNANLTGGSVDLSNFANAQRWVTQTLTSSVEDSASSRLAVRQARGRISGEIAADGYALALTARQQAADMASRAQSLADQVGAASNLREDVAANSAIMLAIHEEMSEIQALLAANLALQSNDLLSLGDARPVAASNGTSP
jgi:type IV secretion system protein VirB5